MKTCPVCCPQVVHKCCGREWSKLKVPPGQHVPLGLLAGQLCSRILAPWNVKHKLELSPNAPLISRREWDASWQRRGKEWAAKKRPAPGDPMGFSFDGGRQNFPDAKLLESFRPKEPKPWGGEWDRYPDYCHPLEFARRPTTFLFVSFVLSGLWAPLAAAAAIARIGNR